MMKPSGLWVSVEDGDGWRSWCQEQHWGLDRFAYCYAIDLERDARILHIDNESEFLTFARNFGASTHLGGHLLDKTASIRWAAVAAQWQGIVIAPYQWRFRLDFMWYYGWDCSSGCIWDVAAIKSWRETCVPEMERAQ